MRNTIAAWRDGLRDLASRWAGASAAGLDDWGRRLDLVIRRRQLDGDSPFLVVVLGPTGAGKSTLLNALVGEEVSTAGVIRPTTSAPVLVARPETLEFFRADPVLEEARLGLEFRPLPDSRSSALVDTPDFDSVEPENRRRSEALLWRADRVILVVNPDKYGDQSVWSAIETLEPLGNLVATVFNKDDDRGARADFAQLMAERHLPEPVSIPRQIISNFLDLPAATRNLLRGVLDPPEDPAAVHAELRARAEAQEQRVREAEISPWIQGVARSREKIEKGLETIRERLSQQIVTELPLQLDDALRRQLVRKFATQVERIDIFREPRRWVRETWGWVRDKLPFAGDSEAGTPRPDLGTAEWMAKANADRFQEFAFRRFGELRELAATAAMEVEPHFPWAVAAPPEPEALDAVLRAVFQELEDEIIRESERIAEGLPMLSKMGFYGSQLAVHAVALVIFVKTGGLLSGGEVVIQGLSSPILARVVGKLISDGEATALERRLSEHYSESLIAEIAPWFAPLEEQLARVRESIPDVTAWEQAVNTWREA